MSAIRLPMLALAVNCVVCLKQAKQRTYLRQQMKAGKAAAHAKQEGQWEVCADEGEAVSRAGRVRFGWAMSWVEASLPSGASCSLASFASDPAPFIRKVCECAPADEAGDSNHREEMGTTWSYCGTEGSLCDCPTGAVRFGKATRWVTTDQSGPAVSGPIPCEAESFDDADPDSGVTKECWCEKSRQEGKAARVAIVLLSRHPPDLTLWLKYHLGYMGVEHVFMQMEDTPEFDSMWALVENDERQHVTLFSPSSSDRGHGRRPSDDYTTLQYRQTKAMMQAKELAKERGIQWLIHIDDDELLYTPMHRSIGDVFRAMPANFDQAYIPNAEAVYPSADVKSCFAETTQINMNAYTFASYANGKAAVRIADAAAVPAGPHQWRTSDGRELPSIHLDSEPFGAPLLVLHFESCPFTRWEDKFWELGNTTLSKVNSIPFKFYRDSIEAMQKCRSATEQKTGAALSLAEMRSSRVDPSTAQTCSEDTLKQFWAQWKTAENPMLRRQDLVPIRIPWQTIAAY